MIWRGGVEGYDMGHGVKIQQKSHHAGCIIIKGGRDKVEKLVTKIREVGKSTPDSPSGEKIST